MGIGSLAKTQWLADSKYGIFVTYLPTFFGYDLGEIKPDGSWDKICNGFSVPGFVADMEAIGAKHVLWAIAQTQGFTTSPSAAMNLIANATIGQWCPTRDLVAEVATALLAKGISTMVYFAAEGPTAAPPLYAPFGITTDQATDPALRANMIAMVTEYSQRWGSLIKGWWLDGCYVSGYAGNIPALEALMQACKTNNPNAIVAANCGATRHYSLTPLEDYASGEDIEFWRYPVERNFPQSGNLECQWHTIAPLRPVERYLGDRKYIASDWACRGRYDTPSDHAYTGARPAQYHPDQWANYVANVARRGGVLTVDTHIDIRGRAAPGMIKFWQKAKASVRAGQPTRTYKNLATYKAIVGWSLTGEVLPINGEEYFRYPTYANDGIRNPLAYAQCGGQYAWQLVLDLGDPTPWKSTIVEFDTINFPTRFKVSISNDLVSFTDLRLDLTASGGKRSYLFPQQNSRYIIYRAEEPNGPGQIGVQMAVVHLEVYN